MREKNPVSVIIIGIILVLIGTYMPNGVEISNIVEVIGIFNLLVAACQGLGAGLVIGGVALFVKNNILNK